MCILYHWHESSDIYSAVLLSPCFAPQLGYFWGTKQMCVCVRHMAKNTICFVLSRTMDFVLELCYEKNKILQCYWLLVQIERRASRIRPIKIKNNFYWILKWEE